MSEIETVTEIMIIVAAVGYIVWMCWYLRRLERDAAEARKTEGASGDRDAQEGDG